MPIPIPIPRIPKLLALNSIDHAPSSTTDQKGLELYSGGDISSLVSDGQVVVQAGLPYATTTGAGGQPVYIVSDGALPAGVEEHLQR